MAEPDEPAEPAEPSQAGFDIEAARARYRRTMRGRHVRLLMALTLLIVLGSWIYAGMAVWAADVKHLPNHDLTVGTGRCIACHSQRLEGAPGFNHSFAPTCGFCHRQALPRP